MEKSNKEIIRDNIDDVNEWLDKKVEKAKTVIEQFMSGNHLVDFATIESLSDEWQDIAEGVAVRVLNRAKGRLLLQCIMQKGALLLIHAHPDYEETFRVKTGVLLDKESDRVIDPKNPKTFPLKQYHTIFAIQKTDMEIDCIQ